MTILAHKIALDPNRRQATQLARAAGVARFSWNWALEEWKRQYTAHREAIAAGADPKDKATPPKPNARAIRGNLNRIKRERFPWMLDSPATASAYAVEKLGDAWNRYFKRRAARPRFKARGKCADSFAMDHRKIAVSADGRRIKLGKLGWHRLQEAPRFKGELALVTISRTADRWFIALGTDIAPEHMPASAPAETVGIDLGISAMATLSTGEKIVGPKALDRKLARLRRLSRRLSRKTKGGKNRRKAVARVSKLHARIANIRKAALHEATTDIARRFSTVVLETLNVRGMMSLNKLARSIADVGMHEFARQIAYKVAMRGGTLIRADRWFPSSKICFCCGVIVEKIPLNVRHWTCAHCGTEHDRDVNAARNLAALATAATSAVAAHGVASSLQPTRSTVGCAPKKWEPNIGLADRPDTDRFRRRSDGDAARTEG